MILTKCCYIGANWCLNMDAMGHECFWLVNVSKIFYKKLLNQLKPNIVRMILARYFLNVVTLVLISQPRWPPWQELASTWDDIGKWIPVKTFLRNDEYDWIQIVYELLWDRPLQRWYILCGSENQDGHLCKN